MDAVTIRQFLKGCNNIFDDPNLLAGFKVRVHRQRQDFCRQPFRDGEITCFVTQGSIRSLKVERHGIVDLSGDIGFRQTSLQLVAIPNPDHVKVIDTRSSSRRIGQDNALGL